MWTATLHHHFRFLRKADMHMMMFSQKTLENKKQRYPRGIRTNVIAVPGHAVYLRVSRESSPSGVNVEQSR